jgi:hypothetical protein
LDVAADKPWSGVKSIDVPMAALDDSPRAAKQFTLANRDGTTIGQIGATFGIPLIFDPLNSSKEPVSIAPPRAPIMSSPLSAVTSAELIPVHVEISAAWRASPPPNIWRSAPLMQTRGRRR